MAKKSLLAPLNDYEREVLLPIIVKCLRRHVGKDKAITNSRMCEALVDSGYDIKEIRMRKIERLAERLQELGAHGVVALLGRRRAEDGAQRATVRAAGRDVPVRVELGDGIRARELRLAERRYPACVECDAHLRSPFPCFGLAVLSFALSTPEKQNGYTRRLVYHTPSRRSTPSATPVAWISKAEFLWRAKAE